jgi:pyruvate, water dikinase
MEQKKGGASIPNEDFVKWFFELSNKDVSIAGGKGASLSEMYNAKFPVPPGFMITAQSFDFFLSERGLKEKISSVLNNLDREDTTSLDVASKNIRDMIEKENLPKELETQILEAYHILSSEKTETQGVSEYALNILKTAREPVFVSVRSSATCEDLADASFAGQQESFLSVKGDQDLITFVKKCMSSLFTPRAIYYRQKQGFEEGKNSLAVVVQKMINSEKSGVVFSRDPVNFNDYIIIEAVFGLGEGIVLGRINPDNYIVSRDLEIKKTSIMDKKIAIVKTGSGETGIAKLSPEKSNSQVLTNGEITELADYAIKLENHYKKPQDIEFAIEDRKIYIVQSRPITTLNKKQEKKNLTGKVIVSGLGASPGVGIGVVRLIKDMTDLPKIKQGDVLVTEMTNPDMVVAMKKSVAIVTDEGGLTSHASIVSREMGIPCVVGTGTATKTLKEGMKITVDGSNGKVYEGEVGEAVVVEVKPVVETKILKVKLMVDLPDFAERARKTGLDNVGLVRLEGIIANFGKHPVQYEKENRTEDYSKLIEEGVRKISEHFKEIWIRTSDIRTDEYAELEGAPAREINPMLGFHGIRFSLKHPKIFEAELKAIKDIAIKYPDKKFGIMFPQIITISEVRKAKEYFNKFKTPNMRFGVMIETPAAVQIIEDICKEGIEFISFGTNDLTQYTLAVDRGDDGVQYLYNELEPSILSQLRRVITICKRYNVETSICGQAGSDKRMVENLFNYGINSVSVNADAAYDISFFVRHLEEKREMEPKQEDWKNKPQNQNQYPNKNFKRDWKLKHKDNRFENKWDNKDKRENIKIESLPSLDEEEGKLVDFTNSNNHLISVNDVEDYEKEYEELEKKEGDIQEIDNMNRIIRKEGDIIRDVEKKKKDNLEKIGIFKPLDEELM